MLLALAIFVLFRLAFAAVLAVVLAVPYAVFGAVNETLHVKTPEPGQRKSREVEGTRMSRCRN